METVILYEIFRGTFKRKLSFSLCYHTISVLTCICICIWLIFRFAYLAYHCFCAMVISVYHLSIVNILCAWCLPEISHVMFALRLLSFNSKNLLDSSVSDLWILWFHDFVYFAYLSLNVVLQIP